MEFIILHLSYKGNEKKNDAIKFVIQMAAKLKTKI